MRSGHLITQDALASVFNLRSCERDTHDLGRPLRIMVATSIRDVGADDHVGQTILVDDHAVYMKGTLENLLDVSNRAGPYENSFEIVGVVTDDVAGKDALGGYGTVPQEAEQWVLPHNYRYRDTTIADMVRSVPSNFRKLPLADTEGRKREKSDFERRLCDVAQSLEADVILSDQMMIRFEQIHHMMPVINIHPAVTNPANPHCCRGKTPTKDVCEKANRLGIARTGATLHFVNDEFDDGLIIAETDHVLVQSGWSMEKIRLHEYRQAKNPVSAVGVAHLARNFKRLCAMSGQLQLPSNE